MTDHIPDTNKKVEPMTLDEFDAKQREYLKHERGDYKLGAEFVLEELKSNRTALEAGMRGVLRDDEVIVERSFVTGSLKEHKLLMEHRKRYNVIYTVVTAEFVEGDND